jgi:hypothetical protein
MIICDCVRTPEFFFTTGVLFCAVVVDSVTYFYPIGNTSAVHLTRNLPRNRRAEILLLGCGDIRNIVFTVYMDQGSGLCIEPTVSESFLTLFNRSESGLYML